uniref:Ovule protein n=1 Tax=Ascaris lumbricoides TaxID=6252 RepID=A0A0M3IG78_ASCLU
MVEKYSTEILKRLLTTSVKICSPHSFVEPCHVRLLALFMEVFVDYRVNYCDLQHNAQTVSFRRFVSHVRSL